MYSIVVIITIIIIFHRGLYSIFLYWFSLRTDTSLHHSLEGGRREEGMGKGRGWGWGREKERGRRGEDNNRVYECGGGGCGGVSSSSGGGGGGGGWGQGWYKGDEGMRNSKVDSRYRLGEVIEWALDSSVARPGVLIRALLTRPHVPHAALVPHVANLLTGALGTIL